MFKDYYIGRRGFYHNKNVIIMSTNHDIIEYQDFGFDFKNLEIVVYVDDGSKRTIELKGNQIKKIELYD